MVPLDIAISDLDPGTWRNVFRLLAPPSALPLRPGAAPRRGPLVVFIEHGACTKAFRVGQGRLDPATIPWAGRWSLAPLRRATSAPIAVAVEDDVLERLAAALERRITPQADWIAQLLDAGQVLKGELGRGLHVEPEVFGLLPLPSYAALQRTLDLLLPDDRTAGLFVFDQARGGALWASLIVEKRRGEVVRLTTHAALGYPPRDWRGGRHRDVLRAMESRLARPHAAIFCTLDAWREVVGPDPGALAKQFALGQVVLDPAPPWLLAFASAGAVAGVAQEASRLFGRFVPQVVKDTARAMSPFAALGFDPIDLFTKVRRSF